MKAERIVREDNKFPGFDLQFQKKGNLEGYTVNDPPPSELLVRNAHIDAVLNYYSANSEFPYEGEEQYKMIEYRRTIANIMIEIAAQMSARMTPHELSEQYLLMDAIKNIPYKQWIERSESIKEKLRAENVKESQLFLQTARQLLVGESYGFLQEFRNNLKKAKTLEIEPAKKDDEKELEPIHDPNSFPAEQTDTENLEKDPERLKPIQLVETVLENVNKEMVVKVYKQIQDSPIPVNQKMIKPASPFKERPVKKKRFTY